MTEPPTRIDRAAEAERMLKELISLSDENLRAELVRATVRATGSLRASGKDEHNFPGWYTARTEAEIAAMGVPVCAENLAFPVPAQSPTWHNAEQDCDTGLIFRFFATTASLQLERPKGANTVQFHVLFGLTAEATLATEAECEGAEVQAQGGTITIRFTDEEPVKTVHFRCPVTGVPAKVHPGTTDERLLSAAISAPQWGS